MMRFIETRPSTLRQAQGPGLTEFFNCDFSPRPNRWGFLLS